jgi:hypothetical protein
MEPSEEVPSLGLLLLLGQRAKADGHRHLQAIYILGHLVSTLHQERKAVLLRCVQRHAVGECVQTALQLTLQELEEGDVGRVLLKVEERSETHRQEAERVLQFFAHLDEDTCITVDERQIDRHTDRGMHGREVNQNSLTPTQVLTHIHIHFFTFTQFLTYAYSYARNTRIYPIDHLPVGDLVWFPRE